MRDFAATALRSGARSLAYGALTQRPLPRSGLAVGVREACGLPELAGVGELAAPVLGRLSADATLTLCAFGSFRKMPGSRAPLTFRTWV